MQFRTPRLLLEISRSVVHKPVVPGGSTSFSKLPVRARWGGSEMLWGRAGSRCRLEEADCWASSLIRGTNCTIELGCSISLKQFPVFPLSRALFLATGQYCIMHILFRWTQTFVNFLRFSLDLTFTKLH